MRCQDISKKSQAEIDLRLDLYSYGNTTNIMAKSIEYSFAANSQSCTLIDVSIFNILVKPGETYAFTLNSTQNFGLVLAG